MSCQQTPITTVWTPTTSNVPATSTVVHTSIITPSPSISVHVVTSCLSTRKALPTAQLHVSGNTKRQSSTSKNELASDTKTKSPTRREHDRFSFSFWSLLPLSPRSEKEKEKEARMEKRQNQVPSVLPSDCISWTIKSTFSTPAVTPSTALTTSTVVSTTQTVVWLPKETVWGGCESASSTESAGVSTDASTLSSLIPAQTSAESATISEPASTSPAAEPSAESSPTGEPSAGPETPETSSPLSPAIADPVASTKQWVEETSKLNSMASALSAEGTTSSTTLSATLSSNVTAISAITLSSVAITTTSEVGIAPIGGLLTSSTSTSGITTSPSTSSRRLTTSSSADAGAATQGAMAVTDDTGPNKAVSVGATIGGIVGLIGVIALLLMGMRWYMRWKRGNKRKTIKMRQSWYPPGYDGPDHFVPTPVEKDQGNNPAQYSFFSMNGKNAISGGTNIGSIESNRKSRLFPGFRLPNIGLPFFPSNSRGNERDDISPESNKRLTMPAIFAGPLSRFKPTNVFPSLTTPWSPRRQEPNPPSWAEKYSDEPPSAIFDGSQPPRTTNRDVSPPRSIMMRPPGFDGVVGPPRIDYQPPQGHMSWGLPAAAGLGSKPKLEWGHSYAASSINPNPRQSVMPPLPPSTPQARPFVPGPIIPSSPTDESVYSKRDSRHSGRDSRQSRQSKQSFHSRRSIVPSPLPGLNRKASRTSNPDLRSAILSRASASTASLGNWSMHSGASDRSIPALPEGGLRFDFPLPPTPSTRAPTMYQPSVPPPPLSKQGQGQGNRALIPPPKRTSSGRKPVPNINMNSSVFEYEDYTRESTVPQSEAGRDADRDTIRQTANWYEKPLWIWSGQSGPLPRIPTDHGMLDGTYWRQSQNQNRKSVKWDPADGVARAL